MLKSTTDGVSQVSLIIGLDEAGYGPWFGPLGVAAVVLPDNIEELMARDKIVIKDSKKMTETTRARSATWIQKNALWWKVMLFPAPTVDTHSNLVCDMYGMSECIRTSPDTVVKALVDGSRFMAKGQIPKRVKVECVVKGDSIYLQIAAASILAKVAHDEWVHEATVLNPWLNDYNVEGHKGYVNAVHCAAVVKHGLTAHHRLTWNVKSIDFSRVETNRTPVVNPAHLGCITEFEYVTDFSFGRPNGIVESLVNLADLCCKHPELDPSNDDDYNAPTPLTASPTPTNRGTTIASLTLPVHARAVLPSKPLCEIHFSPMTTSTKKAFLLEDLPIKHVENYSSRLKVLGVLRASDNPMDEALWHLFCKRSTDYDYDVASFFWNKKITFDASFTWESLRAMN